MTAAGRNGLTLAFFSAVLVAFTWPLVTDPIGMHLSRQFDMYSLQWLSAAAPTIDAHLSTTLTGWPEGEHLVRPDSFVLLGLAKLLSPIDPRLAPAVCTLAGPVVSAWAAERFSARCLGARWPWSLLAGLAYGFSGIAATAILEGHVYMLLDPWLPLLAWAMFKTTSAAGRTWHGVAAAATWSLALLTSAYIGIAATVLVLVFLTKGLRHRTIRLRPALGAALPAILVGVSYVALFTAGGSMARPKSTLALGSPLVVMSAGQATLASLASWSSPVDTQMHSMAPTLGFTALALALFAPFVLRGVPGWRVMLAVAGVGIALSLGPTINLYQHELQLPWLLWPLKEWPAASSFFHFPVRMAWLSSLGLGAVAALVASRLAQHRPLLALPLLACAVVDALIGTGAPLRTRIVPISAPSAYEIAPKDRAVLELLPIFQGNVADFELYMNNLSCSYQAIHQRPLLNECIGTTLGLGPRRMVGDWLAGSILTNGPVHGLTKRLANLGVGAVAVHPDLFTDQERAALLQGCATLFGPPAGSSRDGGEYVVIFTVPKGTDPPERWVSNYREIKEIWQ
ncbi:MAG: hypothetical protein GXP62_19645 [Oligoflexia bacterium]|nr:hypothetical protein [Oligoflexia bacterium]